MYVSPGVEHSGVPVKMTHFYCMWGLFKANPVKLTKNRTIMTCSISVATAPAAAKERVKKCELIKDPQVNHKKNAFSELNSFQKN